MSFISGGEVMSRIMLDPASTIKYIGINSSNPYAKSRSVTLGFDGSNCVGTEMTRLAGLSVMPVNPAIPPERIRNLSAELKAKYPDITVTVEEIPAGSGVVPTAIKIEGLSHLRALVKHLADMKLMKESDVEKLVPRVREVEKHLMLEKELVSNITPKQCDIIVHEFIVAIQHFGDACKEVDLNKLQLPLTTNRDLALSLLVDCIQRDIGTILYEQLPDLKRLEHWAVSLKDLYFGNAGLENKLTENCFTCPTLEKQREFLFKQIEKTLNEFFGPENPSFLDPEMLKKVQEQRAQLFVNGEILDMLRNGPYKMALRKFI